MIEIGATIHLELKKENKEKNEEEMQKFKCRLVDRGDGIFIIDQPINEETKRPGYFYDGTEFEAWFVGKDQAVYTFETEILSRRNGTIPTIVIRDPGKENLIRIQRRNYVRVDTLIDVAIHPIEGEFSPFTTGSIDLSGGGLAVGLPKGVTLEPNKEVLCWLALHLQTGEVLYIRTICSVIRTFVKFPEKRERASLQFLSIDDLERQKVIKFCFEKQLAIKRKS